MRETSADAFPALPAGSPDSFGDPSEDGDLIPSYADLTAPDTADPLTAGASDADGADDDQEGRVGSVDAETADDDAYGRINTPVPTVDGLRGVTADDTPTGIRIGTMILRPTLTQKLVHETDNYGTSSDRRTFSETTLEASLESDWARHKLTVTGEGSYQKNISGTGQEDPDVAIDAVLDLDISELTSAQLSAGYDFSREDRTDPGAVAGATAQAGVHRLSTSAALSRDIGKLRGTGRLDLDRTLYGDAELASGSVISGDDRDNLDYGFTARLGYALSPSLIPFLEAAISRTDFDQEVDSVGHQRSATTYELRAGAEMPVGEKISGEFSLGYLWRDIDDAALASISGLAVDATLTWSPQRGTQLATTLSTTIESSTAAGESGSVAYQLQSQLSRELRHNLDASLTGSALYRDYTGLTPPAPELELGVSGELDWSVNRWLSLIAEAGYEKTTQDGVPDSDSAFLGLGLRLRR
ncbi:outer membrane beta-barrel protein [Pseudohoeflea coraliihabitans]|uniref:Outer membrane beta-barrel protein n=1 Tax=Pseudohoeflea coraliihabitans TaxID=2860393 RepID=A0ABS6WK57_9HYPH|nr:outer membrane beta-barrel protein [Pseudohoeflea sp. DP4N28-3]MBW3096331.1 outer membrane beta-barrel protein [Pseudohoeflea sp. DP4N28-3]